MRFEGKIVLVTGSSRGIGRAIALAFAREGADVVVNYVRSRERAEEVADEIAATGRRALVVRADISQQEEVKAMVEEVLQRFGRLDVLVNNAADFSAMGFAGQPRLAGHEQDDGGEHQGDAHLQPDGGRTDAQAAERRHRQHRG
jgi:NAD(P)-dependent dehydrogenase (short-subunit alcohol dehydrogenase family)